MINLDKIKEEKQAALADFSKAVKENDEAGMSAALDKIGNINSSVLVEKAQGLMENTDNQILAARGQRVLTSQEGAYYDSFIEQAKKDPKMVLTNVIETMPLTTMTSVLEDVAQAHPLLTVINFVNTTGLTKYIVNAQGVQTAVWGDLNTEITKELEGAFEFINVQLMKCTAYFPIANDMLDLGANWLDQYVRACLVDALATALETAIAVGTGKNQPIGMCKDVSKTASVVDGVYPDMKTVSLTEITPETMGPIIAGLTKSETGHSRVVDSLILVVSPTTYFTKLMPATTAFLPGTGKYVNDVLPIPCTIIQSVAVPDGKAIFGMAKRYFMGVGMAKDGKIEYDDSYKFLEDQRVYKIKTYGNGRPLDSKSFVYLDISKLVKHIPEVKMITESAT